MHRARDQHREGPVIAATAWRLSTAVAGHDLRHPRALPRQAYIAAASHLHARSGRSPT